LAEFVGIVMGDGGITKRQVAITLNYKTDKLYAVFVSNIIKELFKIKPAIYFRRKESLINIVVSRTRLVEVCESIGLKIGNKLKQGLDMPQWIKKDRFFSSTCIRGLIDTDGCVFSECHKIKNKKYCYPRLCLTSYSPKLCSSVAGILKELGFSPKIRIGRNVQLENKQDIIRYFSLINTHNPHIKKCFKVSLGGVGSGYPKRF